MGDYTLTKEDHVTEAWRLINEVLDDLEEDTGCDRSFTLGMLKAITESREN